MSGSFGYCPLCATPLVERRDGDRTRMTCPSCPFVQYRNPAPAAGVVVIDGAGVLLVRRRFEPFRGLWTLPAGFVEAGEEAGETAVREAREETGLEVALDGVHAVESCFDDPRGDTLLVLYEGRVAGGEPRAGDDAAEVRFFPLDALPEIAFECHRRVLQRLRTRFVL